MPTASHPDPDDHDGTARLSSDERRVLASIEQGLVASDPHLDRVLQRSGPGAARLWWPLSATCTVLLVVAMPVFVIVGALVPTSWWAALAVITTLVVPCLLLFAIERRTSDR